MFRGSATVNLRNGEKTVSGVWLYRPDVEMWFVNDSPEYPWGTSFDRDEVSVKEEE